MNLTVGFRTVFGRPENGRAVLRLAGGSLYRVYLNGRFVLYGPARAAHGYYRSDEVDLSRFLQPGDNLLAVEVAGYNVNSYYLLDEPAFLQAEIISGDRVLAATGRDSEFTAVIPGERVQKVPRYSFQRTFTEVWRLAPGSGLWRTDPAGRFEAVPLAVQPEKKLIPRRVPYPEFTARRPYWQLAAGRLEPGPAPEKPWYDRAVSGVGPDYKGYPLDRLEANPTLAVQKLRTVSRNPVNLPLHSGAELEMAGPSWRLVDFGANLTGLVGLEVEAADSSTLYLTFDEVLTGSQDVDFHRLGCSNVIALELAPGGYRFESFEPYTLRYLKLNLARGRLSVKDLYLREYANPRAGRAIFESGDRRLVRLFEAGRETFRQNAVDLFTDCPSRERAGWLCDSYFTARAGFDLTGGVEIEKTFLENFVLPDSFARLPAGMLPMCYPADHTRGTFIPNWALWFVLELEEYLARSGDRELVEAARPKVSALFDYFDRFTNRDGLLEGLESWVFIEWSAANEFTQDVSYPSNFLYAAALEAAGRLYDLPELTARSENVRRTAGRRAFDGEFFVDNAVRTLGWLHNTTNRTEVNQYFAFYFGAAGPDSHPELWRRLVKVFGPRRDPAGQFAGVHPAAPFIGKMLRLEVLSRQGLCRQVVNEALDYYLPMSERTGTLWEFDGALASCNHGFASHVCSVLLRDCLGIYRVDPLARQATIRLGDSGPAWCRGSRPVPGGEIRLAWRKDGGKLYYRVSAPDGWSVKVENDSGLDTVPSEALIVPLTP